jgi:flagellar hook-associated protein 3 FlgL
MIGRITQQMTSQQAVAELNKSQDALDTTQQELSTGKSINQPSDNPYGASQAVTLNGDLSSLTNYTGNVTDGTAWASAADSSLSNISNIVQRVRELTVGAANGTQSASDLQASAAEVNQLIDSLKQEANAQYAGQYIFSGNASSTPPYSTATGDGFQGNAGAVNRAIGPGSTVQVNTDATQLFGTTPPASGTTAPAGSLISALRQIATDMSPGGNVSALGTTDLTGIDANLSTLGGMQANIGSTEDRLQLATTRISNLQINDSAALSNTQDANMASTITDYSTEQAAYQASLRATANIVQQSLLNFLN